MSTRTFERRVDAGRVSINPREGTAVPSPEWLSDGQDVRCVRMRSRSPGIPLSQRARNQACIEACSGESAALLSVFKF